MNGIEKRAGYYRGYLTDDRSLIPLTIVLGIIVGPLAAGLPDWVGRPTLQSPDGVAAAACLGLCRRLQHTSEGTPHR